MIRLTGSTLKYLTYAAELALVYILQFTPGLVPLIAGEAPMLLTVCAVSIALLEGNVTGMWFGMAAGLLLDVGSTAPLGMYALAHMALCYGCGLLVMYVMRNNVMTSLILGAAAAALAATVQWICLAGADWGETGLFLGRILLPRVLYSTAVMPAFFYLNRAITTRMYD